jgi:hypothetical protein
MSAEGGSPLILGLGVVVFLLLAVFIVILILENRWRNKIEVQTRKVIPGFNQVQMECKRLAASIRQYSRDDPPPYGQVIASIEMKLDQIANRLTELKKDYIQIQGRLGRMRFRTWQRILSAPFYWYEWYQLSGFVDQLVREISSLEVEAVQIWENVKDIDRQAWLVAQEARQALDIERDVRRLMELLGDHRLTGDRFEEAAAVEEKVIDALDEVPRFFFTQDEENINSHATRERVVHTYAIVSEIRPPLDDLLQRLSGWEVQYNAVAERATSMHQRVLHLQDLMASLPKYLLIESEKAQITSMRTVSDTLMETMTRLEVESIPLVEGEIERIDRTATELGRQIRRGLRDYASLSSTIIQMESVQKELSALISKLAKNSTHPLIWDQSRPVFRELNKRIAKLGEANQPRTIADIDENIALALDLSTQLARLSDHCTEIATLHQELLSLFVSEDIKGGIAWAEGAQGMASQTEVYNPANWPKQDSVETLLEDLRFLASRHKSTVPADESESIKESEIAELATVVAALAEDTQSLRARSDRIQSQLIHLQEVDKGANDRFNRIMSQFHQISWLVNSNPYLKKNVAADLERLRKLLDRNSQKLSQQKSGLMEKKELDVNAAGEEISAAANRWLVQLNQDVQSQKRILEEKLNKLEQFAALEDPAIDKARRLLEKESAYVAALPSSALPAKSLEMAIEEMQKRCNTWQEFFALEQELVEVVENPLVDAVQNAEKQRKRALDMLAIADRQIPPHPTWPPTDVSISSERRSIGLLEVQVKSIKSQPVRAIWAVRRYGELAASYQAQAEKIEQALHWAGQEQQRVIDLEDEIGGLLRTMQRKELSTVSDPQEKEQLNRIRSQVILEVETIRERWSSKDAQNRHDLNYDDVVQELQTILSRLRNQG